MGKVVQGSDDWLLLRLGKVTASRVYDILPGKSGYRAARGDYMAEKVCEILTGKPLDSFISTDMQWGIDTEPEARAAYEAHTGQWVDEEGFFHHPTLDYFGYSPDGLIDDIGGIEIKCPKTKEHLNTLLNDKIKPRYITQIQASLLCSGREWWDFVSYDPRLNEKNRIYIKRVYPDNELFKLILQEVSKFYAELMKMIERLD